MAYNPQNSNGQAAMAASAPVVIASNQSAVPVSGTITAVTAITNALPAGTNLLGKVGIDQTTPGTTNLVALAANQSVNTAQISGTALSVNNGTVDAGTARVTIASNSTGQVVLAAGTAAIGTLADQAGNTATLTATGAVLTINPLNGASVANVQISGTYAATLGFQGTIDGTNWFAILGTPIGTGAVAVSTLAANAVGQWLINVAGLIGVRVNCSAWTSNTSVSIYLRAGNGSPQNGLQDTSGRTILGTGAATIGALTANQSINNAQINGITPLMGNGVTGTGSQRVTIASDNTVLPSVGAGATGTVVPANASYDGVLAQTALPAAATAGNLTGALSDKYGRQVIINNSFRDTMGTQTTTIAASTAETTIIAAAAAIFNDLSSIFISNTSATAVRVDIRDATAGAVIFQLYIPAGDMRGLSLTTPWPQTTVNNNWTATSSASVTDLRVSALFIKNK